MTTETPTVNVNGHQLADHLPDEKPVDSVLRWIWCSACIRPQDRKPIVYSDTLRGWYRLGHRELIDLPYADALALVLDHCGINPQIAATEAFLAALAPQPAARPTTALLQAAEQAASAR